MRIALCLLLIFTVNCSVAQKKSSRNEPKNNDVKEIDVVFCLDMSASTNGLLEDLKENYWSLINHSNMLKPNPRLRISLVGFARPSFGSKTNFVKVLAGLTENYDSLYEVINKLHVNVEAGDQCVGQALMVAVRDTEWSKNKSAAKMIFLMGNGTVNLGPSNLDDACKLARSKGIIVHTAYCTNPLMEKEIKGWEKIANECNGISSQIVINKKLPAKSNLTSKELWSLNRSYNSSFIYYGESGRAKFNMMTNVDSLTVYSADVVLQSRLLYKTLIPEEQIKNWDLIACSEFDGFNLYNIDRSTLPPEFSATVGPDMLAIIRQKKEMRIQIANEIKTAMADELNDIKSNRLMKEDIGEEGLLNRIVIKDFIKTALNNGFWL